MSELIIPAGIRLDKKDALSRVLDSFWGMGLTEVGLDVSPVQALRNATAYSCVRIICETVAQMPVHAFERGPNGEKHRDQSSFLHRLFTRSTNPWTTPVTFKMEMQLDVLLYGAAYALIQRQSDGTPHYLQQLPARAVRVEEDRVTMEPRYVVTLTEGGTRTYRYDQILHLRPLGGMAPIQQCREAIGLALAQELELSKTLSKGQRPSGVLTFENAMTDVAIDRAVKQFAHLGESKGTAILDGAARYHALDIAPVDAQYLEMRRHQVAEIARAFRIPLNMLQELERVTHQNAEEMGRQFLTYTMTPWLTIWESEIALKLTPEDGSTFVEFVTDSVAKADLAARMEAHSRAVTNGIRSPNEVRQLENLPPYPGGDQFRLPMNTEAVGNETQT
ncbi:MAG: phage portal protein [Pseudomonadota bacterium]